MSAKDKALSLLLGWSLMVSILMGAIHLAVFDGPFFMRMAKENHVESRTGITYGDLETVRLDMMDYLDGNRDNFDIVAPVYGVQVHLFTEDEQRHMEDVYALMRLSKILMVFGVAISLAIVALPGRRRPSMIYWGCVAGPLMGLVVMAVLAVLGTMDFTAVFEEAHRLIFTNDLWLLNPATSVLINIVPEPYFISLSLYAASMAATAYLIILMVAYIIKSYRGNAPWHIEK